MSAGPVAPRCFRITTFRAPRLRPGGDPTACDHHTWPKYGLALALELHELEATLSRSRPFLGKYQGEFYVGGQLRESRRLVANVLVMDVPSLDVDHVLTPPEVHERLRPWHEMRVFINRNGQIEVEEKRFMRRQLSFWTLEAESPEPPRRKAVFVLRGHDRSGSEALLALRLPATSRAVDQLRPLLKRRTREAPAKDV